MKTLSTNFVLIDVKCNFSLMITRNGIQEMAFPDEDFKLAKLILQKLLLHH